MIIGEIFLTMVSVAAAVIAAFVALLSISWHKRKQDEMLKQACSELCDAISVGEINAVLNNAMAIINKKQADSNSLIVIQNQLQLIVRNVNAKWNRLKVLLLSSRQNKLSEKMEAIVQEYLFCLRDVETVVFLLGSSTCAEVEMSVVDDNSDEIKDILKATKSLCQNKYEFVSQIISLRFNDLELPDYATTIRSVWTNRGEKDGIFVIRLRALTGDALAQCSVGDYYNNQKQFKKALFWYRKSAKQDFPIAQYNLGVYYEKGLGEEKNEKEAFLWYRRSAEQGLAVAQFNLGVCYDNGIGTEKNEKEAFVCYKKSSVQGFAEAQYNIGVCYEKGIGIEPNAKEAFFWYRKSAEQGFVIAQYYTGVCYDNARGVEENKTNAFLWYKKAAKNGNVWALYNLGIFYERGIGGIETDEKEAFICYKESAEQGLAEAQYNLAVCYQNGRGVEIDEKEAFTWYKKSAEQGLADACYNVGYCYLMGIGCSQNYERAFNWFNKVLEKDYSFELAIDAAYNIGLMLFNGMISGGNYLDYFINAAQCGDNLSQNVLGYCYENGKGVKEIDIEKAKYWYRKAAEQNNQEAIASLARLTADVK